MLSIFLCAFYPFVCLLWRNVYLGLLLIYWTELFVFFLTLSCMNYLYILEINPLDASFSNVFSHFVDCLFILFLVSVNLSSMSLNLSLKISYYGFKHKMLKYQDMGTFLVAQWLRLHTPNAGGPDVIPSQGTRSHMPQLRPGIAK